MKSEGLGASEIAKILKIGRASVYRRWTRLIAAPLDGSPTTIEVSPAATDHAAGGGF
jgi:DNA invertase Pin-like site-specific DNA recombinase